MSIYQFVFLFIVPFSHLNFAVLSPLTARELPVLIPVSKYRSHKLCLTILNDLV